MTEAAPRYIGLNELVEELGQELSRARFRRTYSSRGHLVDDMEKVVSRFLERRLASVGLEFQLWRGVAEATSPEGIEPTVLFGAEFCPDLVAQVSKSPAVALHAELVRSKARTAGHIAAAIGASLAYARRYPAVLTLVHMDRQQEGPGPQVVERELVMSLWSLHKVRLVFS
ncbi:MAG: hypothetical protein HYY00_01670 [Chloroflexi bacterium]|nr:hypothetical protein [Chloroflexota bacterium]